MYSPPHAELSVVTLRAPGGGSTGSDMLELAGELRTLKGVLQALEREIAGIAVGDRGFTAPGAFLFDLLERVGVRGDTHALLALQLDRAVDLLANQAADQGKT